MLAHVAARVCFSGKALSWGSSELEQVLWAVPEPFGLLGQQLWVSDLDHRRGWGQFGPTPWLASLRSPWPEVVFPSPCQPLLHGGLPHQ